MWDKTYFLLLWSLFKCIVSSNWQFNWIFNLNNSIHEKDVNLLFTKSSSSTISHRNSFFFYPINQAWTTKIIVEFLVQLNFILMYQIDSIMLYACIRTRKAIWWLFNIVLSCSISLFRSCSVVWVYLIVVFGVEKSTRI